MLYGNDLLDGFSSVEELWRDDAFAETVLGSQGNKEDLDVLLRQSVPMMKGTNGKVTCDR